MRARTLFLVVPFVVVACQQQAGDPTTAAGTRGTEAEAALTTAAAPSAPRLAHGTGGLPLPQARARLARGEYLVTVAGCNDCHTPWVLGPKGPEPDMTRKLSGHPESLVMPPAPALGGGPWLWSGAGTNTAFAGPWGVSYAPNLTPDASGLAAWDEQIFIDAMRTGKHMGRSRDILPPMPWQNVGSMTDEDLRCVFAYLRSIPPVVNHAPEPAPPAMGAATTVAAM